MYSTTLRSFRPKIDSHKVVSPGRRFARWQTTVCNKAYQKRSCDLDNHIRDTKRVYIGSPVHKVYIYRSDRVDLL